MDDDDDDDKIYAYEIFICGLSEKNCIK